MARTYKRDSRGRFSGGGGSSGGSGGGKRGRPPGASGRKVGTRTQQKKAAAAQADRNRRFSSKAAPNAAKAAYKAASSMARDVMSFPSEKRSAKATMTKMRNSRGTPANPGPRGGKVGSSTEQRRNAAAQAARTRQFSSKAAPNTAKAKYKAAKSEARLLSNSLLGGGTKGRNAAARVKRMERTRRSSRARI